MGTLETATISAVIGALVTWVGTHLRDREQKRRDIQTQYLIDAYRRLEFVGHRDLVLDNVARLESAIADIQLLGTPRQVELAHDFAVQFAKNGAAPLDALLEALRSELRRELRLQPVSNKLKFLRISISERSSAESG